MHAQTHVHTHMYTHTHTHTHMYTHTHTHTHTDARTHIPLVESVVFDAAPLHSVDEDILQRDEVTTVPVQYIATTARYNVEKKFIKGAHSVLVPNHSQAHTASNSHS